MRPLQGERWFLLGYVGGGKSTVLLHTCLALLEIGGKLPVWIPASTLASGDVLEVTEKAHAVYVGKSLSGLGRALDAEAKEGNVCFLLDDVDRCNPGTHATVVAQVHRILARYPKCGALLTGVSRHYPRMLDIPCAEIRPFKGVQQKKFLLNALRCSEQEAESFLASLGPEISENPLFLACASSALDAGRTSQRRLGGEQIILRFVNHLLSKTFPGVDKWSAGVILEALCLELASGGTTTFASATDLRRALAQASRRSFHGNRVEELIKSLWNSENSFIDAMCKAGVLVFDRGFLTYRFCHRVLFEYFLGKSLLDLGEDDRSDLIATIPDSETQEWSGGIGIMMDMVEAPKRLRYLLAIRDQSQYLAIETLCAMRSLETAEYFAAFNAIGVASGKFVERVVSSWVANTPSVSARDARYLVNVGWPLLFDECVGLNLAGDADAEPCLIDAFLQLVDAGCEFGDDTYNQFVEFLGVYPRKR